MKLILAALALCILPCPAAEPVTLSYTNPLWDGYLADPFVLKDGDAWYAIGTGDAADGRQFPILESKDFTHWKPVGGALERIDGLDEYWAPEIAVRDGKYYLYYAGNRKMRVAVADKITGPYKDTGKLMFPELEFSIDGHPFHDPKSGDWYFYFAKDFFDERPGTALAAVKLKDDMITPEGPQHTVMRAFADWQIYERDRDLYDKRWDAWHTVEGPTVIVRDGAYQLFYSGGNWQTPGYGVGHASSENIFGPFSDKQSKTAASVIQTIPGKLIGPGHNSVVLGPDGETWFIVYHSWNPERTKRQICMDPLVWTKDGPVAWQPSRGKKEITLPLKP